MIATPKLGLLAPEDEDFYAIDYVRHNNEILDEMLGDESTDSTTVIADDNTSVTTTYADGSKVVVNMDDTSIIETYYDAEGNVTGKKGTYIDGNTIEEKELSIT